MMKVNKSIIHRFLNKQLSREELKDLHTEINADEETFMQMMDEDWDTLEYSSEWPEKHWNKLEPLLESINLKPQHEKVFRLGWLARVAASLLIIASVWFVLRTPKGASVESSNSPEMITHSNNSEQSETVFLKDGTKVILAANSSLSYYENFNNRYRVVHLDGEAVFETDQENVRPFIVISDNITSICRSHEFSISAFNDSEEINVVTSSGRIEIAQNNLLNSEFNKVAVQSCQRYSFNKSSQKYLIGKVADCDFDEKVRSMKSDAARKTVVML